MPTLPFKQLDVLVVQYIGKEISGAGMDSNITGRAFDLKDTLHTVEFLASKALFQELETIEQAQILEQVNLVFDERGNLIF